MNIVRIALNVDIYTDDALAVLTGAAARAWAGTITKFQIGLFKGKIGAERLMTSSELAEFVSANLGIFAESRTGNPFCEATIAAEDFDDSVTDETWEDGTKQHLSFVFSAAEMELPIDSNKTQKNYWWVLTANAEEQTLGGGTLEIVRDRDATNGPRQAGNLVPQGAIYSGGGTYVLNGLTIGKVYKWVAGTSGFDSFLQNGAEEVSVSNKNFTAQATSVTLYGEGDKAVSAVVWAEVFLTAEESDARYPAATENFTITTPAVPAWDTWVVNGARRAIVNVSLSLYVTESPAEITLVIQDDSGTWSHLEHSSGKAPAAADSDTRLLSFPLSPGAKFKLQNTADPDGSNQIIAVRISEF